MKPQDLMNYGLTLLEMMSEKVTLFIQFIFLRMDGLKAFCEANDITVGVIDDVIDAFTDISPSFGSVSIIGLFLGFGIFWYTLRSIRKFIF